MFLDVIRVSFEAVGNLFNPGIYIRDAGWMTFLLVLIAVAPIIIYGLFNLCFWFFSERKLEKSVVQSSVRRRIKQIVGILLVTITSFFALSGAGAYFEASFQFEIYMGYYVEPILSPVIYTIVVLGFIAFVKYTIGNIVKLIAGAIKRKKKKSTKSKIQKANKESTKQNKLVVDVESDDVRKIVLPKTREFLNKYKKEGNIKQVIKNHTKEYKELLLKETEQFYNNKDIAEHYYNRYSK